MHTNRSADRWRISNDLWAFVEPLLPAHENRDALGRRRAESARSWLKPGRVGIASRCGGMTSSTGYYLSQPRIGLSTLCHLGGYAVIGTPLPDAVLMFRDDPDTDGVVNFGEIGGTQEERIADLIADGDPRAQIDAPPIRSG